MKRTVETRRSVIRDATDVSAIPSAGQTPSESTKAFLRTVFRRQVEEAPSEEQIVAKPPSD